MNIAFVSDTHAGIGKNDPQLRSVIGTGIKRSTRYLSDLPLGKLILNGDVTDHVGNTLAEDTDRDVCLEACAPLVQLVNGHRQEMQTVILAGNTDWVLTSQKMEERNLFFDYTGINQNEVVLPPGGLEYLIHTPDGTLDITHGHTQKPAQWGHEAVMTEHDQLQLQDMLQHPTAEFLDAISAVSGSHREDFLRAQKIGTIVQKIRPQILRRLLSNLAGRLKMTPMYEPQFAQMLRVRAEKERTQITGIMGHTHIAGVRTYEGVQILNSGTAGAKPNPLERASDPKAHVIIADTTRNLYKLVCTFDAGRPSRKPYNVREGMLFPKS